MKTDVFTVNREWRAVELNGVEISTGTFTVVSLTDDDIGFIITDTQPIQQKRGDVFLRKIDQFNKYSLVLSERLWAKSTSNTSNISVIQA